MKKKKEKKNCTKDLRNSDVQSQLKVNHEWEHSNRDPPKKADRFKFYKNSDLKSMIGPMCTVIMANTIPIDSQFSMPGIVSLEKRLQQPTAISKNTVKKKKTFHYQHFRSNFHLFDVECVAFCGQRNHRMKSKRIFTNSFNCFPKRKKISKRCCCVFNICFVFISNQKRFTVKQNVKSSIVNHWAGCLSFPWFKKSMRTHFCLEAACDFSSKDSNSTFQMIKLVYGTNNYWRNPNRIILLLFKTIRYTPNTACHSASQPAIMPQCHFYISLFNYSTIQNGAYGLWVMVNK